MEVATETKFGTGSLGEEDYARTLSTRIAQKKTCHATSTLQKPSFL